MLAIMRPFLHCSTQDVFATLLILTVGEERVWVQLHYHLPDAASFHVIQFLWNGYPETDINNLDDTTWHEFV